MRDLNYITVGTKIKERRKAVGRTQEFLANALDVNASHICNIEAGRSSPSLTALVNIANALECSVDYFIDAEYHYQINDDKKDNIENCEIIEDNIDKQILRYLRYCDYDTKYKIYEIMKILSGYDLHDDK